MLLNEGGRPGAVTGSELGAAHTQGSACSRVVVLHWAAAAQACQGVGGLFLCFKSQS